MKEFSLFRSRFLEGSQFWLLSIATALVTIHLVLSERIEDASTTFVNTLFWFAVCSLVWQKRDRLNLQSDLLSSLVGWLILAGILFRCQHHPSMHFLGVSPFLSGLGLALIASGFRGLKQYWQELGILFFLGVPRVLLAPLDISIFTAKVANGLLWYAGFDAFHREGSIFLPGGAVNVYMACSGLQGILHLLGLSIMALLVYPIRGVKRFFVPVVAIVLAFIVNVVRVIIMALLANAQNFEGLEYWHFGYGSHLFSLITVMLFGLFYLVLLRQETPVDQEIVELEP